jgi:predicted enzyme related to lactoylglutathione lyase
MGVFGSFRIESRQVTRIKGARMKIYAVRRFVGVSLQVDDAQATYERLVARGVEFHSLPEKQSWGGVLASFMDTSGNVITLMSERA